MDFTQEQKLYNEIVQKAWDDAQFKSALMNDPVATIEKFTDKSFSATEGQKVVVVDQTDESTFYFNIPRDTRNIELTEEQLEAVAGGAVPGDLGFDFGVGLHNLWNKIFN